MTYNVIIHHGPGGMEVRKEARREPPAELAKLAHATIEDLEKGASHG